MRLLTIKVSLYLDPIISTRSIIIHIIFCALGRVAINCPEALPKKGSVSHTVTGSVKNNIFAYLALYEYFYLLSAYLLLYCVVHF